MKIRCINDLGSKDLTINKEYMVIYQGEHWFEIINDSNNNYTYLREAFEIVEESENMKEYSHEEVIKFMKIKMKIMWLKKYINIVEILIMN